MQLKWFRQRCSQPQKFRVQEIRFVGEQDGEPERLIKNKLDFLFRTEAKVSRAYLATANFGERTPTGVVLAIRVDSGAENNLVNRVAEIFASIFNAREHLDVMFLSEEQELQLKRVCQPFYEQKPSSAREPGAARS